MNTPNNPGSVPSNSPAAAESLQASWNTLLAEMTELHARLEYLRVMLKIGVRSF